MPEHLFDSRTGYLTVTLFLLRLRLCRGHGIPCISGLSMVRKCRCDGWTVMLSECGVRITNKRLHQAIPIYMVFIYHEVPFCVMLSL